MLLALNKSIQHILNIFLRYATTCLLPPKRNIRLLCDRYVSFVKRACEREKRESLASGVSLK